MKDLLVGSTGFVGVNIMAKHRFNAVCHSTDVTQHYGSCPDLCVYSGVPATMYIANENPEEDFQIVQQARKNLKSISPKKVVLISTIAVYGDEKGIDESFCPDGSKLSVYGRNRLQLEEWVRDDFPNALILHLPALYGIGLKKNFLFDLRTIIPFMLREDKFLELREKTPLVEKSYAKNKNGFYVLEQNADRSTLREFFLHNDFNALSFTDSRSRYQFYNLNRLWSDIQIALKMEITSLNLATPPVTATEVYSAVTGNVEWVNKLERTPYDYDMRTIHDIIYGSSNGYIMTKEAEMADICQFMREVNR